MLIAHTNGNCTIVEANALPVSTVIGSSTVARIDLAGTRFTPPAGLPIAFPSNALTTLVFDLGNENDLSLHIWSVDKGRLMLHATNMTGGTAGPQSAVANIVSIKALYGFDTTNAAAWNPDSGLKVSSWNRSMIDADNDGTVGNPGDYQRIAAVRLAVVARSSEVDKPDPQTGECTTTTTFPTVFASNLNGAASVPVAVNPAVAGDAISWKCYRYKAFEMVIPLRNAGWRPGT
jgi:type IV pilus assembly protein PilW